MHFFFPVQSQPVGRIFHSSAIGSTALAILFSQTEIADINPYQLQQTKGVCERADNQF